MIHLLQDKLNLVGRTVQCSAVQCSAVVIVLLLNVVCVGKNPTDQSLEAMMNEAPGPINFTMFLTMFGEKLNGTDPEDVIKNAFACFDDENKGKNQRNAVYYTVAIKNIYLHIYS